MTVTVRCHGDLGDLLPRDLRGRDVVRAFDVAPSVKDVVEALGVPHTEVGLLTVDGEPVGFDHRLEDGQRVAVHPHRAGPGRPAGTALRGPPPEPLRFAADIHLLALARRLRLLGFDTVAGPDLVDDDVLVHAAVAGDRVLLSRDRGVLKRRVVVHGSLVRADDPQEQLVEVARRWSIVPAARPFTRCMACNGELGVVAVAEVVADLPPRVRAEQHAFSRCSGCGRVYWPGSHHRRLLAVVDDVRRRAPGAPGPDPWAVGAAGGRGEGREAGGAT